MKCDKTKFALLVVVLVLSSSYTFAQKDSLRTLIEQISEKAKGDVGVCLIGLENNDTLSFNGNRHFPMQSVYKFPVALAVLTQVDKGMLSLDKKIFVKKKELLPKTWSPLREKYPNGNVKISLNELLTYTVSMSDNNGCDILFKLVGGTKMVNDYIHNTGIKDIAIVATEEEMHKNWNVQFTNWCTPIAMCNLLNKFYKGEILSKNSTKYLRRVMEETSTGSKRIKGSLPAGTIVAHKTGSSGSNEEGIIGALNDVGIVTLPNGNHLAIVVFISNSSAEENECEKVIAEITKVVWDRYVEN
ncbi:MAG: class A beta-lactamase, subclass A2 [Ignavibacteria bacterium]|nr:class A beta-lactamase, subclass A2 [Ignavibacteria bacterium]